MTNAEKFDQIIVDAFGIRVGDTIRNKCPIYFYFSDTCNPDFCDDRYPEGCEKCKEWWDEEYQSVK